jgi:hypothetical protein
MREQDGGSMATTRDTVKVSNACCRIVPTSARCKPGFVLDPSVAGGVGGGLPSRKHEARGMQHEARCEQQAHRAGRAASWLPRLEIEV